MVKKKYEKPQFYCEKFEMSKHIATCAWDMMNHSEKSTCKAASDPKYLGCDNVTLFTHNADCELLEGDYEDYCYTNGGEGFNVFSS